MKCCVGALTLGLWVAESQSLKGRRSTLSSIKERVRRRFNVSVTELDHGEKWQLGGLLFSCAAESQRTVENTLRSIIEFIEQDPRVTVLQPHLRFYE